MRSMATPMCPHAPATLFPPHMFRLLRLRPARLRHEAERDADVARPLCAGGEHARGGGGEEGGWLRWLGGGNVASGGHGLFGDAGLLSISYDSFSLRHVERQHHSVTALGAHSHKRPPRAAGRVPGCDPRDRAQGLGPRGPLHRLHGGCWQLHDLDWGVLAAPMHSSTVVFWPLHNAAHNAASCA